MNKKPIILCIMDGYGIRKDNEGNAVNLAKKPNLDMLMHEYPHTELEASGERVGLPEGQMGNSEVGHLNMGAGRVVYQSLTLLNKACREETIFSNEYLVKAFIRAKETNTLVHIFGLLSDGGVHSHINHFLKIVEMAKKFDLAKEQLVFHCFLDGRDVPQKSAIGYLDKLNNKIEAIGVGIIATIGGRYYVMDRDKNLSRVDLYYKVMTERVGNSFVDYKDYLENQYKLLESKGQEGSDEFIIPAYNEKYNKLLSNGDNVIFMNFRPDRAIQIATVVTNPHFYEKPAKKEDGTFAYAPYVPNVVLQDIYFVCMMKYADSVHGDIAYKLPSLSNTLGEFLAAKGYKQLRIAETEKYAHVTFFFDGTKNFDGVERAPLNNCRRVLVNSPKVATYDLKPSMSAEEVTDKLIIELEKKDLDVVILNFANCDMVGHTAILKATETAVETVDNCVGRIYEEIKKVGGTLLITADHGNAEQLIDENGLPMTKHTTNLVPFILCDKKFVLRDGGALNDIAPTILDLLGERKPEEMDGNTLIKL